MIFVDIGVSYCLSRVVAHVGRYKTKPTNTMAKTTKTTKSAKPAASTPAPAAAPEARNRKSVLVKLTPAQLRDKIGADTPIGVSRKELTKFVTAGAAAAALADIE